MITEGALVGGIGVAVEVGGIEVYVAVGGTGVYVAVGGTGVGAGAHPLNIIIRITNARHPERIGFFMIYSPFDLIAKDSAQCC